LLGYSRQHGYQIFMQRLQNKCLLATFCSLHGQPIPEAFRLVDDLARRGQQFLVNLT
jgi:hypothetical protein